MREVNKGRYMKKPHIIRSAIRTAETTIEHIALNMGSQTNPYWTDYNRIAEDVMAQINLINRLRAKLNEVEGTSPQVIELKSSEIF
jgi:hypothetical protein